MRHHVSRHEAAAIALVYDILLSQRTPLIARAAARGLPLRSMFSMKEDDTFDPVLSLSMQMDRR